MVRLVVWFAGVALLLAGCARMPVNVPSNVGTAGVLVAEIRSNFIDVNGKTRALGIGEYQSLLAPEINGTTYSRALQDGFLVLTLPPGEYRLTNMNHGNLVASFTSWLATFSQGATTAYPLDIKFTIERGRATYLGKLYLYAPKRNDGKYAVVAVDDSKGMIAYLRSKHPQLYASLSSPELLTSPQEYLDTTQLATLRKAIAARKVRDLSALLVNPEAIKSGEWQARALAGRELVELAWEGDMTRQVQHVGGQLGTLARLVPNTSGKIEITPLDSGTLAGLDWCTFDQERGICPLPDSGYLLVRGSTVTQKAWPDANARPALLRVFGRSGIVAVDRNGTVWVSLDDGATWKSHAWLTLQEPMRVNDYDISEPYSAVGFRRGKQGVYLYARADLKQTSLLYVPNTGDGLRQIDLPADARRVRGVIESPGRGLLVAAHPGSISNEMIYFMPLGEQSWIKREIPAQFCPHFLPEQSGASMRLVCSQGQFRSVDLGKTWNKLPDDVALR